MKPFDQGHSAIEPETRRRDRAGPLISDRRGHYRVFLSEFLGLALDTRPGTRKLSPCCFVVAASLEKEYLVIKWPERYHPSRAPIHVVNELTIPASCEQVWAWLIRAPLWPSWYPNSSDVRLVDRPITELRLGTMFTWRTFGVKVQLDGAGIRPE